MARPKSTSKLVFIDQVYPRNICNGIDTLTSMFLIPHSSLPDELGMVEEICAAWGTAAYWIAYDMMPIVDTSRPPYIYKNFRQYRSWAKVLYAHQNLCAGCKENGRSSSFNTTPFWRWIACMEEIKLGHFFWALSPPERDLKRFISPPEPYFQSLIAPPAFGSKPDFIHRKVCFYEDISAGRIPSEISSKPKTNTAKLYKDAHYLAFEWRNSKRSSFKTQYWDPLVSSYKEFVKELKIWPANQMPLLKEQQRYVQDKKQKKRLPFKKLENVASNEVVTITYKRWSQSGVYVPECNFSNI